MELGRSRAPAAPGPCQEPHCLSRQVLEKALQCGSDSGDFQVIKNTANSTQSLVNYFEDKKETRQCSRALVRPTNSKPLRPSLKTGAAFFCSHSGFITAPVVSSPRGERRAQLWFSQGALSRGGAEQPQHSVLLQDRMPGMSQSIQQGRGEQQQDEQPQQHPPASCRGSWRR